MDEEAGPEAAAFDPVAHASRHAGVEALVRLQHVARDAADGAVQRAALERALQIAAGPPWTVHDADAVRAAQAAGIAAATPEVEETVVREQNAFNLKLTALDDEIEAAKASLSKARIYEAHRAKADLLVQAGDYTRAIRQLFVLKSACVSQEHTVALCRSIVVVGLQSRQHGHVATFSLRGRSVAAQGSEHSVVRMAEFACAHALSLLHAHEFQQAWEQFSSITLDLGDSFAEVALGEDIAIYGALCVMATRGRGGILEALAQWRVPLSACALARSMLEALAAADYRACLGKLDALRDPYLGQSFDSVCLRIRRRAVEQHLSVYARADLRAMAAAFAVPVGDLESDISALIAAGDLTVRIDADAMVVVAREENKRAESLRGVRELRGTFERDADWLELRLSLVRNGVVAGGSSGGRAARRHQEDAAAGFPGIGAPSMLAPQGGGDEVM